MSKDKKKDVFDELVNDPTFIKEADDAWKNIDKLPSFCPHCNCMTKTIKSLCGKCGGSKNNTPYIEEIRVRALYGGMDEKVLPGFMDFVTKTIEGERERVCMDGYIDGHNDGRWISKKKLENEKEKYLKGFIIKMFGKRCKEYEVFCPVCEMWELCDEYIK